MASCAGGQGAGSLPSGTAPVPAAHRQASAKLELRLKIPPRRRARYVSPSTQSLVLYEDAHKLGTFDVTPVSNGCYAQNGTTYCRFSVDLAPGSHETFSVDAYDAAHGTGNVLSTGKIVQAIVPGVNLLRITLGGVIASLALAVQDPNPLAGSYGTLGLVVMAKDVDGNVILGPGNYTTPISLTDSDTTGTIALSATTVASPGTKVSLNYTGGSIGSATIGATAGSVPPASVTVAPQPSVLADLLLPFGAFTAGYTEPTAIANGSDGNLWIGLCCGQDSGIIALTTSDTVVAYYLNGTYPSGNLPQATFNGMTLGTDKNVWYAATGNVGFITTGGLVTNFPLTGGSICAGANGQQVVPSADSAIWVSVSCTTGSQLIKYNDSGVVAAYNLTSFTNPGALALDSAGNVYVAGTDSGTSLGAVLQATVAAGAVTGTSLADVTGTTKLVGVVRNADGDFWATTAACGTVAYARVHPAAPFAGSAVTTYAAPVSCSAPAFLLAASGTLWAPDSSFALATRVMPAAYPANPAFYDLALPSPIGVSAHETIALVGPDGNLYVVDETSGGDVVQVAF